MNGIAGTSISKTTYYITNTSGITSLDSAIAKHFN
jgi:hypothetical protein